MRDALTSPVRITVGQGNAANEDIKQVGVKRDQQRYWIPSLSKLQIGSKE